MPFENETLADLGENALVGRIKQWLRTSSTPSHAPAWAGMEVLADVGDDTAVVRSAKGAPPLALTTDMLIEGVHFFPDHPPEQLGAKAVGVNLSDLAAAGAWPQWILVSLGLPGDTQAEWVERLYQGIGQALAPFGCLCLGGDCVRAEKKTINIVAGGACQPDGNLPLRSRAVVGQSLYVTGNLGDSGAGLELLRSKSFEKGPDRDYLVARHRTPSARVEAGVAIARYCPDAAMMDLSDGLAQDIERLAQASNCGFTVRLSDLPLSGALKRVQLNHEPWHYALFGGEDYELLFTTSQPVEQWCDAVSGDKALQISKIGEVESAEKGIRYLDNSGQPVDGAAKGFHHY